MLEAPEHQEVDYRTLKLMIGGVALGMAPITSLLTNRRILSISQSYWEEGWPQTIFVGGLFAIAALMFAFNGRTRVQMILAKGTAVSALGVALFPCGCEGHPELVRGVHWISAAAMFIILAFFCYAFAQRARGKAKAHPRAAARAAIYYVCGAAILLSIGVLAFDAVAGGILKARFERLTFYGESAGLLAFGISWLTSSRVIPGLTGKEERFSPLRAHNPV